MAPTREPQHEDLTEAVAREERDAVLAALAHADDAWLDAACTDGLDTREMSLLDDLGVLETVLTARRSA